MRILSRYLLKEHLGPFTFAGLALTGLLVLNQVALRLANLIGKGLGWGIIGSVFGLSLPFIVAMTLPMAVLVAVLHAFTRLGADSEITALKASGVKLTRLVRPVLIVATLIGLFEFLFVDQVLPWSNHKLKNLLIDIARKKPTFELAEQSVNELPGSVFLRAGRIDQATDRMREVVIYDLANATRRRTIYADSGYIRFNAAQTDLFLTLFDGYIHDYDRDQPEQFRRIFFGTDVVRVVGVSNQLEHSGESDFGRGDREMGLCEMEERVHRDFVSAANLQAEADRARVKDALALVGVVPPPADTSNARISRRTLSTLYCGALGLVGSIVKPGPAGADTIAARRIMTLPQTTTQATTPIRSAQVPMHVVGDPTGQLLRGQLGTLENQRKTALADAAPYQVEIHKKYSLAVACIVFVMIGAPVALRFPRGGIGLVIGASVAIFGVYYIGLIGGEALGDGRLIPPFWAMWAPNFIMGTIGLLLFARLGREQATARGGTPAWTRLAQRLRRRRKAAR